MTIIADLTYRLGPRVLFDGASAQLPEGARVGFVGRNGAGKTTLFRLISGEIAAESGSITLPRRAKMGWVEQEAPGGPGKLIDFVLAADIERAELLHEAETAQDPHRIAEIHTPPQEKIARRNGPTQRQNTPAANPMRCGDRDIPRRKAVDGCPDAHRPARNHDPGSHARRSPLAVAGRDGTQGRDHARLNRSWFVRIPRGTGSHACRFISPGWR